MDALNNLHVVWHDHRTDNNEAEDKKYTASTSSWGSIVNLSNGQYTSKQVAVTAAENKVFVVWGDNLVGNYEIYFTESVDNGSSFGVTPIPTNTPTATSTPTNTPLAPTATATSTSAPTLTPTQTLPTHAPIPRPQQKTWIALD